MEKRLNQTPQKPKGKIAARGHWENPQWANLRKKNEKTLLADWKAEANFNAGIIFQGKRADFSVFCEYNRNYRAQSLQKAILLFQNKQILTVLGQRLTNTAPRFSAFLVVAAALALSACASTKTVQLPAAPVVAPVATMQLQYPILLLHGLGQKAAVWDAHAVQFYERDMGLKFGGVLKKSGGQYVLESRGSGFADFFTVSFSNPVDSIGAWKNELEQYVRLVLERTKAEKVIVIGYSMGGVTGRYYMASRPNDHRVQRLITIGSPHQGSPFAKVWKWKTGLKQASQTTNPLTAFALGQALKLVASLESDVPFDAPAVRDLMRPEDGGEFMRRTGALAHPLDAEYISVVGKVEVLKELESLSKSGAQELLRRALEALGFGVEALFSDGDGVVSAKSQTMNELPWFQADPARRRISRTITLNTVHEDHLRNSTEIQRISLEDEPEFKGADFYSVGGQPALVVEFSDYFPPQRSTIEITVTGEQGAKQSFSVPKQNIALARKNNGSTVAQAVFFLPQSVDLRRAQEFSITATNSFGSRFSVVKQWSGK